VVLRRICDGQALGRVRRDWFLEEYVVAQGERTQGRGGVHAVLRGDDHRICLGAGLQQRIPGGEPGRIRYAVPVGEGGQPVRGGVGCSDDRPFVRVLQQEVAIDVAAPAGAKDRDFDLFHSKTSQFEENFLPASSVAAARKKDEPCICCTVRLSLL
jgi:hypothetical protein